MWQRVTRDDNLDEVQPSHETRTEGLERRALLLEYATIAWNVGEAVLTISLGSIAGSLALISFGTVSIVEVFASSVVVWHFRSKSSDHVARTQTALRLIAVAFVLLGVALAVAAVDDLLSGRRAGGSPWGIAYLAVTALVMFSLAGLKGRTARDLGSEPLRSEATVTFLDGVLSATTLAGLALNAYAGWWWADPLAGLLVALAAVNEAWETWGEAEEIEDGAGLI
jgi:divalent metal cation (Fe/Co/Zn/Cd) transporter